MKFAVCAVMLSSRLIIYISMPAWPILWVLPKDKLFFCNAVLLQYLCFAECNEECSLGLTLAGPLSLKGFDFVADCELVAGYKKVCVKTLIRHPHSLAISQPFACS